MSPSPGPEAAGLLLQIAPGIRLEERFRADA